MFRKKKKIKELLVVESSTSTIVDADKSAEDRLKQIIKNEASKIGDIIWSNRINEPVVVLMFLSDNRIRVGNIYLVSHEHYRTLLAFLTIRNEAQAPQSI